MDCSGIDWAGQSEVKTFNPTHPAGVSKAYIA